MENEQKVYGNMPLQNQNFDVVKLQDKLCFNGFGSFWPWKKKCYSLLKSVYPNWYNSLFCKKIDVFPEFLLCPHFLRPHNFVIIFVESKAFLL